MRTSNRLLLALGFSTLQACGDVGARPNLDASAAPSERSAPPRDLGDIDETPPGDPAKASAFFVWTRDDEGRAATHRLDPSGRELDVLDGIWIATPTGTWQWREEDRVVATSACERYDEEGGLLVAPEPEAGSATRVALVEVGTGAEQVLVPPPDGSDGAEDFRHDVELVASVGTLLFVCESTYVYTCGAHGTTGVSTMIWDAATSSLVARPVDLGLLEPARGEAMRLLVEDDDGFPATPETTELTELVPRFDADGSL